MRRTISFRKYYNSRAVAGDGYKVADLRERRWDVLREDCQHYDGAGEE
jgi:hypothetical protein